MFTNLKISTKIAAASMPLALAVLGLIITALTSGFLATIGILIALIGMIATGVLLWMVGDSMSRRIDSLGTAAEHVSRTQLPMMVGHVGGDGEPLGPEHMMSINDSSTDEIGHLAAALNATQPSLAELVSVQQDATRRGVSEIFVTLARRNRTLVDRQLALLDDLEADVEDPELLADYYKLDHLATRMRRNAESLLVLAGAETRRRRADPVAVGDVIRAGISEIEDYQRARPMTIDDAEVIGPVVGDLAHMLAELLDNATSFSPPDSEVKIAGAVVTGGYTITIEDLGIGISPSRLTELNELLSTAPTIGLGVEPTLGLSVVSLLTEKHAAKVAMSNGRDGGTVVTVFLPQSVFASGDFASGGDHAVADAVDTEYEQPIDDAPLPVPAGQTPVSTPLAPPVPDTAAEPFPEPAVVERESIDPLLPSRTPGAAAPTIDEGDSRVVPAVAPAPIEMPAPLNGERWGNAVDSLAVTAATPSEPLPTFVLPTRSPGQSSQPDETPAPAGQTSSTPDDLRSKLNAFRSMSNAAPATTNEGDN